VHGLEQGQLEAEAAVDKQIGPLLGLLFVELGVDARNTHEVVTHVALDDALLLVSADDAQAFGVRQRVLKQICVLAPLPLGEFEVFVLLRGEGRGAGGVCRRGGG
jgi:hypothetical protein